MEQQQKHQENDDIIITSSITVEDEKAAAATTTTNEVESLMQHPDIISPSHEPTNGHPMQSDSDQPDTNLLDVPKPRPKKRSKKSKYALIKRKCHFDLCDRDARSGSDYCIRHGGGPRCVFPLCTRGARDKSGFCIRHGGGPRCQFEGCNKGAEKKNGYCILHARDLKLKYNKRASHYQPKSTRVTRVKLSTYSSDISQTESNFADFDKSTVSTVTTDAGTDSPSPKMLYTQDISISINQQQQQQQQQHQSIPETLSLHSTGLQSCIPSEQDQNFQEASKLSTVDVCHPPLVIPSSFLPPSHHHQSSRLFLSPTSAKQLQHHPIQPLIINNAMQHQPIQQLQQFQPQQQQQLPLNSIPDQFGTSYRLVTQTHPMTALPEIKGFQQQQHHHQQQQQIRLQLSLYANAVHSPINNPQMLNQQDRLFLFPNQMRMGSIPVSNNSNILRRGAPFVTPKHSSIAFANDQYFVNHQQ